jgi:hypothetical protein
VSPTKPANPSDLVGLDASLASLPMAQTPRGGMESPFAGESGPRSQAPAQPQGQFAGMGPLLEEADADVFKATHALVMRQELIALNHLAQDSHWTFVKLGYPWSTLTKEPNRDVYKQTLPYGSAGITVQAVPNKTWDLINKTTEAILQDFPVGECEPGSDSEQAQSACEMGNRFLADDASEQGTNDPELFHDRVERSLTCSSSYLECWTDPTGGGYIPLQIKAHPQAVSPDNPLVGPDGSPTTDYVLRYVTAPQGGQFTDDPSQAAPQWQPKLRAAKWEREHVRVFPESKRIEEAEKVIILGYCTLGEARRRWKTVGQMAPEDLSALCDWTPPRYLVLLPPFQRARWKQSEGRDKEKAGSSDERIMFYYHVYAKASPDYKKGCDVVVTGAHDGLVLDKQLLAKPVEIEKAGNKVTEIRCLEIPMVQVTPRGDPDERDPSGRAFIELFAGAAENNAYLMMSFSQIIDAILHTPFSIESTSPIEGWQVEDARASGDFLVTTPGAKPPVQLTPPVLPGQFFQLVEFADEALNSIASSERAATGADNSKERSGKALQIAVSRNNVSLSGMNTAVNNAVARWDRIKIEQCMANFTTTQQLSYVGEDGAYKQDEWTGVDFALVGKVTIKAGTGTMMDDDAKIQYLGNLKASQMMTPEEASDAARPSYSKKLGLPPDPHQQRIERQVAAWIKGPPAPQVDPTTGQPGPSWVQQAQAYAQAKQIADQQNAQATAEYQQLAAKHRQDAANAGASQLPHTVAPPQPPIPAQPTDPQTGQPMPAPWTPFAPLPVDNEPLIAALRQRRLGKLQAKSEFAAQPPEWQQVALDAYNMAVQAVQASMPAPPLPKGVVIQDKIAGGNVAAEEQAATHPNAPPQQPRAA